MLRERWSQFPESPWWGWLDQGSNRKPSCGSDTHGESRGLGGVNWAQRDIRNILRREKSICKGPVARVSMVSMKDCSQMPGMEPEEVQKPGYKWGWQAQQALDSGGLVGHVDGFCFYPSGNGKRFKYFKLLGDTFRDAFGNSSLVQVLRRDEMGSKKNIN